jgi:hypothetical protein
MKIAAHISGQNNSNSFLLASLKIISEKYPLLNFILFVETIIEGLGKNFKQVLISPKPKNNLILYFWYAYKLPAMLKKHNKMVFISDAGILCTKSNIVQYLFFCKTNFWQNKNKYFKKVLLESLALSKKIFVTEGFIKTKIIDNYNINELRIQTLHHGLNKVINVLDEHTKQIIKDEFANGHDYYFYPVTTSSASHLLLVLKAFSQLKKLQKTSLKLLLFLEDVSEENLIPNFKNYKYRSDTILIQSNASKAEVIIQAAFALIYFSEYIQNNIAFTAMQHSVPTIVSNTKENENLFANAVLFTNIEEKSLAEKMQLLYKDEMVRNTLVLQANQLLKKYDSDKAAEELYNAILK